MLAEMMPFPNEETTPPVTKIYFVCIIYIVINVILGIIPLRHRTMAERGIPGKD